MNHRTTIRLALLIALAVAVPASELSYGHSDFVASRERPIGWRGNLNGDFLGANPPMRWNMGPEPVELTEQVDGKWVKTSLPPGLNLIWKVPMPNWASCGCIVVNGKVITRASPSTLLCYDAATGERLWYDNTDVWDYHFPNDHEQAKKMRELCTMWERQNHLGFGQQGKHRIRPWTEDEKNEWLQLTDHLMTNHPELFGDKGPQWKGDWKERFEKAKGGWWPTEAKEIEALMGQAAPRVLDEPEIFLRYGVAANKYKNSEDRTISTPVSDGKFVYCASGENLVTCHELETGKLVWMTWTGIQKTTSHHGDEYWPSPWIFADRLIVYNNYTLRGFHLDTGEELWKVPVMYEDLPDKPEVVDRKALHSTGHTHADNCAFMEVGGTKIVVTSTGHVVRATDGKVLIPAGVLGTQFGASYTIVPSDDVNDVVLISHGSGQGGKGHANTPEIKNKPQVEAWQLAFDDQGALQAKMIWSAPERGGVKLGIGPVVHDGKIYTDGPIFDVLTGKQVGSSSGVRTGRYMGVIMISDERILGLSGSGGPEAPPVDKRGPTHIVEPFEYGNAENRKIGENYIAYEDGKPFFKENPDLPVRTWALQALKEGVLSRLDAPPVDVAWGNNLYGQPGFPVGERIYVRSRAMLYCIGTR